MHSFYAFLSRMKYIKRWALMRSVVDENIAEHSHDVSVLAHCLALINIKYLGGDIKISEVILLAQYHEVAEVLLGDMPTPVKYFDNHIKEAYKSLEDKASIRLLEMLPDEFKDEYQKYIRPDKESYEYKILKAADKLSAYIKCLEELKSGNLEFKKAKQTIKDQLLKMGMKEVEIFIEKFLPAFQKTLDEMD